MEKHYLRTQIFLLFLFISCSSFGQSTIRPFEDYSMCQVGFINSQGDTVFDAVFEKAIPIQLSNSLISKDAWIIFENNLFGCLDNKGVWVIPCKYTSLSYDGSYHFFTGELNKRKGILKADGTEMIPFDFDQIEIQRFSGSYSAKPIMVASAGYEDAVYSIDGEVIVERCEYVKPIRLKYFDTDSVKEFYIYSVRRNGRNYAGLKGSDGRVIIPANFRSIDFPGEKGFADQRFLFIVKDTLEQEAVFDERGRQLTHFRSGHFNPVNTLQGALKFGNTNFAYHSEVFESKRNSKRYREVMSVVNLKTKAESGEYEKIKAWGDFFYCTIKDSWTILDTNFKVTFQVSGDKVGLNTFDDEVEDYLHGLDYRYYDEWSYWVGKKMDITTISRIALLYESQPMSREERKNNLDPQVRYSILNMETGVKSPGIYLSIERFVSNDETWYWGIREKLKGKMEVEVYDSSGVFKRALSLDEWETQIIGELINRKRTISYGDSNDNLIITKNGEDKYGALLVNGCRLSTYVFQQEPHLLSLQADSTGVYWFRRDENLSTGQAGSKVYFTDFNGNYVLDSSGYLDFGMLDKIDLFYVKPEPGISFVTKDLKVLIDSCSQFSYLSSINSLKIKEDWTIITLKNEHYYVYTNGEFRLIDSTLLKNPQAINEITPNGPKVYANGKVVAPKAVKSSKHRKEIAGTLNMDLFNDTLKVSTYDFKYVQTIPNVADFKDDWYNSVVVVITKNSKKGILDYRSGKWIVKPVYDDVQPMKYRNDVNEKQIDYWVKDSAKSGGKWYAISASGKILSKAIFDGPTTFAFQKNWTRFTSNGKIGTMDKNFQIIEAATYERNAYGVRGIDDIVIKGNKTYSIGRTTGKFFELTEGLVREYYQGYLFLFNDSIKILSGDGKVCVPPMPLDKAMKQYDFKTCLYSPAKTKRAMPYVYNSVIFGSETDIGLRVFNNQLIVNDAYQNITTTSGLLALNGYQRFEENKCSVEAMSIHGRICFERVTGHCYTDSKHGIYNGNGSYYDYRCFTIENDTAIQVELDDLMINSDAVTKLNEIISREMQSEQVFGLNCGDIPGTISEFKKHFVVSQGSLSMEHAPTNKTINIPLQLLKPLLKHPEYFKL